MAINKDLKAPSVDKLKYLSGIATTYKEDVKSELNECFELADPYFKIEDSAERKNKKSRGVDFSIIQARKFLANFTMANVFNKNNAWAKMQINKNTYMKNTENANVAQAEVDKINITLESNSTTTFDFIKNSNYYTEIAKAVKAAQFGTGIFKINEQNSTSKPFSFEFMGYDNISFTEDALGKPIIVFKTHYPMNSEDLVDRFSNYPNFKPPADKVSENEFNKKITTIELMVGIFDESTGLYQYYNAVFTENFSEKLCEKWTEYPNFIIFRWELESGNPWGTGPARDNRELMDELKTNKEKRMRHRDKIVDPPGNFFGNIELMYKVKMGAGDINYGGSGMPGDSLGYQPYNLGTNLIPLENDISEERAAIQRAFLAQPLGTVDDSVKTATEQSLRIELFNKEWATTGELINTEVLYPTFISCYLILKSKGLLEEVQLAGNEGEYIEYSELVYMNELTKNTGLEEVQQVLNYWSLVGTVVPEEWRPDLLLPEEFAEYAQDKMRIPKTIVPSKEQLKQKVAERYQQQAAMIAAQGGGGAPIG